MDKEEVREFQAYKEVSYRGKRQPKEWDEAKRKRYDKWNQRQRTRKQQQKQRGLVRAGDPVALERQRRIREADREKQARKKAEREADPELREADRARSRVSEKRYAASDKGKARDERHERSENRQQYHQTRRELRKVDLDSKWRVLNWEAGKRGHVVKISVEEARKFWISPCHYCGKEPCFDTTGGALTTIDRVDNSIGYIFSNIVPACQTCNRMKSNFDVGTFIGAAKHLANRQDPELGEARPEVFFDTGHTSFRDYVRNKAGREYAFELTEDEHRALQLGACRYCGHAGQPLNGIDRVDNDQGYTIDNCVSCCTLCNQMKGELDVDVFLEKCTQIARFDPPPFNPLCDDSVFLPIPRLEEDGSSPLDPQKACKIYRGDCADLIRLLPDKSVDLFYTDPPFGMTRKSWDQPLDWDDLWPEIRRVVKPEGWCIVHCSQPFTFKLWKTNEDEFRHKYVWEKTNVRTNHLGSAKAPMRGHEDVLCFNQRPSASTFYGVQEGAEYHPEDILRFPIVKGDFTRPVELAEHFVKHYSMPGDLVLDICMSSGVSGQAALNLERRFLGFDKSWRHVGIAENLLFKKRRSEPPKPRQETSPPTTTAVHPRNEPERADPKGNVLPAGISWVEQKQHYQVYWRTGEGQQHRSFTTLQDAKALLELVRADPFYVPEKRARKSNALGIEGIQLKKDATEKCRFHLLVCWNTGKRAADGRPKKSTRKVNISNTTDQGIRDALEEATAILAETTGVNKQNVTDNMCETVRQKVATVLVNSPRPATERNAKMQATENE